METFVEVLLLVVVFGNLLFVCHPFCKKRRLISKFITMEDIKPLLTTGDVLNPEKLKQLYQDGCFADLLKKGHLFSSNVAFECLPERFRSEDGKTSLAFATLATKNCDTAKEQIANINKMVSFSEKVECQFIKEILEFFHTFESVEKILELYLKEDTESLKVFKYYVTTACHLCGKPEYLSVFKNTMEIQKRYCIPSDMMIQVIGIYSLPQWCEIVRNIMDVNWLKLNPAEGKVGLYCALGGAESPRKSKRPLELAEFIPKMYTWRKHCESLAGILNIPVLTSDENSSQK